jgi:hypothetical protein
MGLEKVVRWNLIAVNEDGGIPSRQQCGVYRLRPVRVSRLQRSLAEQPHQYWSLCWFHPDAISGQAEQVVPFPCILGLRCMKSVRESANE